MNDDHSTLKNSDRPGMLGSPERNLIASIIGEAIVTLHARPVKTANKKFIREWDIRDARRFFAGTGTSNLIYYCDLLDWDVDTIKKAAHDPQTASLITSRMNGLASNQNNHHAQSD